MIWLLQQCILVERGDLLHYLCQLCVTLCGSAQMYIILLMKQAVVTKQISYVHPILYHYLYSRNMRYLHMELCLLHG